MIDRSPSDLVFGEGPKTARIAAVAEAPAVEELCQNRPLVGQTGKLNDRLLLSAGLHRSELFLTNIWKEQIKTKPKNFPYNLIKTEKYKRYKELLYLELVDLPNLTVIAALGELALLALTGESGVTKKRGSVYPCSLGLDCKVLAIRHPSAALPFRNFCLQYVMVHDYVRLKEESAFPEIRLPERDLKINPTFEDALAYLRSIKSGDCIGCDIESPQSVGELTHISFSKTPADAMCIPFKIGDRNTFNIDQETEIWIEITRIAEDPTITITGHNYSFDATYQFRKYGIRSCNMRDSMQAQGIVYAGLPKTMKPKGLAFTASIHTRERYYKDDGKQFNVVGIGSEDNYQLYNARDACVSQESEQKLIEELKQQGNYEEYLRTCQLIDPLVYMGEHGIAVDVDKLTAVRTDAEQKIETLREQMFSEVGREFNPGSIPQLKKLFYVERGHKPYTFKGKTTCDVKAMKRLSAKGDQLAKLILDYRFYSKRLSTYYNVKLSEDGRFKCAYNPYVETATEVKKSGGTKQGRLSSGKNIFDEGTGAQNLPDEMLQCLIADTGYVTYNIDLEQAENRIVAYIAPDRNMIEAFENGVDIHSLTAKHVFGYRSIEEVTRKPPCSICTAAGQPELCGHKGDRFWGKKDNHSLNYGEGPNLFSTINEISVAEARRQILGYFNLYPGVAAMHEWIKNQLYRTKTLTNPFGRSFYFMDLIEKSLKQAYSYIPQTTVAGIINWRGLLNMWDEMRDVELQAQVHDSIRFQVPVSIGWQAHAERLVRIKTWLEEPLSWRGRSFVVPINCEVGLDFLDMKEIDLNQERGGIARQLETAYKNLIPKQE